VLVWWSPPTPHHSLSGGWRKAVGNFHNLSVANDALEVYWRMQLSESIAITPVVFCLCRPQGQDTIHDGPGTNEWTAATQQLG
jgi:hypothetical protein